MVMGDDLSPITQLAFIRDAQLLPPVLFCVTGNDASGRLAVEDTLRDVEAHMPPGGHSWNQVTIVERVREREMGALTRSDRSQLPAQQVVAPRILERARTLRARDGRGKLLIGHLSADVGHRERRLADGAEIP